MIKQSFIIPTYNTPPAYLNECLKSLHSQSMQDCEFILVLDGATKEEIAICERYERNDKRFIVLKKPHSGVSSSRNLAISLAKGEFTTFIDADDWIEPTTGDVIYSFSKETNSDISFWNCVFFNEFTELETTSFFHTTQKRLTDKQIKDFQKSIIHFTNVKKCIPAITICKNYKTRFLKEKKLRFDQSLSFGEDRVFSYSACKLTSQIAYLNKSLYHCRRHKYSATQKYNPNAFDQSIDYIQQLNDIVDFNEKHLIGQEAFFEFYTSWKLCYMHKDNTNSIIQRMHDLSKKAKTEPFQTFLKYANYKNISQTMKIELFLLKRKLTFFVWLHAIKQSITSMVKQ